MTMNVRLRSFTTTEMGDVANVDPTAVAVDPNAATRNHERARDFVQDMAAAAADQAGALSIGCGGVAAVGFVILFSFSPNSSLADCYTAAHGVMVVGMLVATTLSACGAGVALGACQGTRSIATRIQHRHADLFTVLDVYTDAAEARAKQYQRKNMWVRAVLTGAIVLDMVSVWIYGTVILLGERCTRNRDITGNVTAS